ncbi:hypothetical protein F4780DRAFT_321428 [Xylariomycetidae sp. FL0641]|nr:hypothetical protein F4780DRAFT_321428 [Xylariomycetidae sp. FL0641]
MAAPASTPSYPWNPNEVPHFDKRRRDLYHALVDNDSYFQLALLLASQSQELVTHKPEKVEMARNALQGDAKYRRMFMLLHTIPRPLLEAIIMGTVAHSALNQPQQTLPCYKGEGPGAYVAAMSIKGRAGYFTNALENHELIRGMRDYCEAYEHQVKGVVGLRATRLRAAANSVDSQFGRRSDPTRLSWITNTHACRRVRLMIDRLREKNDDIRNTGKSLLHHHMQGPLMVGCSNELSLRMPQHDPADPTQLTGTTYTWALMLCVLKKLNLDPVVTVIPVVRVWEPEQLPLSEILVTALAASYAFQDGFNVVGAGGQDGTFTGWNSLKAKRHVFMENNYFRDNIEATLKEIALRTRFVDQTKALSAKPEWELEHGYLSGLTKVTLWESDRPKYEKAYRELEAIYAQLKDRSAKALATKNKLHSLTALMSRIQLRQNPEDGVNLTALMSRIQLGQNPEDGPSGSQPTTSHSGDDHPEDSSAD